MDEDIVCGKGWLWQIQNAPEPKPMTSKAIGDAWDDICNKASSQGQFRRSREGFTVCGKYCISTDNEIIVTCPEPSCKVCRDFDKALLRTYE